MGLFQGEAPPNVETFRETAQKAPDYLTNYLSQLATTGQGMLGKQGSELVAGMKPGGLEETTLATAPGALTRYTTPLDEALKAGQAAAGGIEASDISRFYDPYQQNVVDELARQSGLNVQRNVLPMLKAAFAGQGGFGSQRYAGALGQAAGDIQANLLGKQSELMSAGYKQALDAALREQQGLSDATKALTSLGGIEQQAATTGLKTAMELGGIERGLRQAEIDAPITRAQNVAQLLRGYQFPTTTTETYKGPASTYGPSTLQQIAGLGSLIGAAYPQGGGGIGPRIEDLIKGIFTGDGSGNVTIGDPGLPDEVKEILGPPT